MGKFVETTTTTEYGAHPVGKFENYLSEFSRFVRFAAQLANVCETTVKSEASRRPSQRGLHCFHFSHVQRRDSPRCFSFSYFDHFFFVIFRRNEEKNWNQDTTQNKSLMTGSRTNGANFPKSN